MSIFGVNGPVRVGLLAAFIIGLDSVPAQAADLRDLCPARPGLGTPACIVDAGHFLAELGLGDWTVERDPEIRTDTVLIGDLLVRYGLTDRDELHIGWTAYGHLRTRTSDRASRATDRSDGTGDVLVALKHSLASPGGDNFSAAVQLFATLPIGGSAIGLGDWSTGLLLPISYDISDSLQLQATPEIDWTVDEDRNGRHVAVGTVVGLGLALSEKIGVTAELSAFRDRDPAGHSTQLRVGLSGTLQPSDDLQLDAGAAFGLNRDSPDTELSIGVSRRF